MPEKKTETPPPPPELPKAEVIKIGGKEYTLEDLEKLVSGQKTAVQHAMPTNTPAPGEMLLARVELQTDQLGSTLHLRDVTPAELMFLVASYKVHSGGRPVKKLELEEVHENKNIIEKRPEEVLNGVLVPARDLVVQVVPTSTGKQKTVKRTAVDERRRLLSKYGKLRVNAMYPGAMPQMPTTYQEALNNGLDAELPSGPEPSGSLIAEKDITKT